VRTLAQRHLEHVRKFKLYVFVYLLSMVVLTPVWIITQYESSPGWLQHLSSRSRYPVVEMLHGRPGSPRDIITGLDPVGASALPGMPPFIGVVPDGHGPVVFEGEYVDTSRQRLGAALSDDLRSWIDAHYRTNRHWSVTGLSSGGYGAAYLGTRRPAQYDSVCSLSGNFTPQGSAFKDQSSRVLDAASPILHARRNGPRTLLIAGQADRGSIRDASAYARALHAAGQTHSRIIVPGGHDWRVWRRGFPRCLRFMLSSSAVMRTL